MTIVVELKKKRDETPVEKEEEVRVGKKIKKNLSKRYDPEVHIK